MSDFKTPGVQRRKTVWDTFVWYDAVNNRIVISQRDIAFDDVWQVFHHDGEKTWWSQRKHDGPGWDWTLLDRLPEGSL